MIQPSRSLVSYHMTDASVCWHICDDSINIYNYESGVEKCLEVTGIDADAIFRLARNAMCCKHNCFKELSNNPSNLSMAKDMIEHLQKYVDKRETETTTTTDADHETDA